MASDKPSASRGVSRSDVTPVVQGDKGKPSEKVAKFAGIIKSNRSACTASLIKPGSGGGKGAVAVLTAAHCLGDGAKAATRMEFSLKGGGKASVECTANPGWKGNNPDSDLALCIAKEGSLAQQAQSVGGCLASEMPKKGDTVTLNGYGGSSNLSELTSGKSTVIRSSEKGEIQTKGGGSGKGGGGGEGNKKGKDAGAAAAALRAAAAVPTGTNLIQGDSGGPLTMGEDKIVGVNSMVDASGAAGSKASLFAAVGSKRGKEFLSQMAKKGGVSLCGIDGGDKGGDKQDKKTSVETEGDDREIASQTNAEAEKAVVRFPDIREPVPHAQSKERHERPINDDH